MIWVLIQFLLMFSLILFLHESGHFIAAKAFGVEVEEFGFGLPPRIVKLFTWKGTDFTLNWLPIGAFVKPRGEFDDESATMEGGFKSVGPWKQLIIYFAGPLMNLLTLVVVLLIIAQLVGIPNTSVVMIDRVLPDSPAAHAGLRSGDVFVTVNGIQVDSMQIGTGLFYDAAGLENRIVFERGGEEFTVMVTTLKEPPAGRGPLGVVLTNPMRKVSFGEGIRIGIQDSFGMIRGYLQSLGMLFSGQVDPNVGLVGPVGIFSMYQDVAEDDAEILEKRKEREALAAAGEDLSEDSGADSALPWYNRLMFFAMISMAVGISNLLPIPALDGGRMMLLVPELIFRKRVPMKVEAWLNVAGMVLIIGLSVYLIFKDVFIMVTGS